MSRRNIVPLLLLLLVGVALLLRFWSLHTVPPWLWWDEASQGLDARDLLHGHFRVFFARAEGKEPLYVYLTTPFVAAFDGTPFAVRAVGALTGVAMLPALYAAGRALWRDQPTAGAWAGLLAAGLWATNFWPQSINRIGFQVNALPLLLTLAVVAWLNWTHRPLRHRAVFFGIVAGLTFYTYLAARVTPLLWLALFVALPTTRRRALRPTLGWAALALGLVVAPLLIHFALHPDEALNRTAGFAGFYAAPDTGSRISLLWDSFVQVAGGFLGYAGDPIPRHNIPNRPPFSPVVAFGFAAGVVLAVPGLFRRHSQGISSERSWTLLLWLGILAFPAFISANSNPHFPRLLAALPAALLLAAWPVARLSGVHPRRLKSASGTPSAPRRTPRQASSTGLEPVWLRKTFISALLALLLAALLIIEGTRTARAYFVTWARNPSLFTWFQGELWDMAEQVGESPGAIGVVPLDADSANTLDYAFADPPFHHTVVEAATVEDWLDATLGAAGGRRVLTPVWSLEPDLYADTQRAFPFYLAREGVAADEDHENGFDLLAFDLGAHPQFAAAGQPGAATNTTFGSGLTLVGARWGAAHPNPDRNAAVAAAGTPLWAILEWRMDQPAAGLRAAVDLLDADGHRLTTVEQPILPANVPLGYWQPGTTVHTYHLIPTPVTQLPGTARLTARAYNAATGETLLPAGDVAQTAVPFATVQVAAPQASSVPDSVAVPLDVSSGPGWRLVGRDALPDAIAPGETLSFRLYWQADAPLTAGVPITVSLEGTGVLVETALAASASPSHLTHAFVDLQLPADLLSGEYPLLLDTPGAPPANLGTLSVAGRAAEYAPPSLSVPASGRFGNAVALLGATDTPAIIPAQPGETITVSLVWQALTPPGADRVRFVHALGPDGQPITQRDSTPCDGACPAVTWRPSEILIDPVRLNLTSSISPGDYPLAAGWYDPATGARLPAYDAAGVRQPGDLLALPITLRVAPAENAP